MRIRWRIINFCIFSLPFLLLSIFLISCGTTSAASNVYKAMGADEINNAEILDKINVAVPVKGNIWTATVLRNDEAYNALLLEAKKKYQGNIDIRNVTAKIGEYNVWTHDAVFIATGNVIIFKKGLKAFSTGLDFAVNSVFEDLSPSLTAKSKMAIVNISSSNSSEGEFVCEELTLLFVRANKYSIVDRRSLDAIKKEQNFHMTGEVDDNSVVSIGQLLGAEVVITGAITGEGSTKRLRVKALDVKTGQIRAMSSQSI